MKSKGFKIVAGALVAIIIVLGGLAAVKTLMPADEPAYTSTGKPIPEGAMEDPAITQSPSGGYDVVTPKGGEEA